MRADERGRIELAERRGYDLLIDFASGLPTNDHIHHVVPPGTQDGDERMDAVLGSVDGSVRFYGLTPTSMKLEGLDRHQRMIDNYKKLHRARAKVASSN